MAKKVEEVICGIDVCKDFLDIAVSSSEEVGSIGNTSGAIAAWLRTQPVPLVIGIESTNDYHEELVEQALAQGHRVYLVNARQLMHYREALGVRAKTDMHDALLLCRYIHQEHEQLRPVRLKDGRERALWRLLKRRGSVVKMRQKLKLSLAGVPSVGDEVRKLIAQVNVLLKKIERELMGLARALGWRPLLERARSVPGIGPMNALALTACYHRGEFTSVDAFIAFIGLDVRVKDSGKIRGKRRLTKQGDPELRRLLYNAAMSFDRHPSYKPYRESLMARGLSSTAAYIIIARKLARVAFALIRKERMFDEKIFKIPCQTT